VDRSKWDFFAELARFGPERQDYSAAPTLAEAEAYCRRVAHAHYENFQIASWLIPRQLRQDFYNIYAYCRWADDCADEASSPAHASALLRWWQSEIDALFQGAAPRHPVMCALKITIERHKLPQAPFNDLISAFAQDQLQQRYETAAELDDYCRRSANPVGRLILGLDAVASAPENLRLSDAICTGLQLANFCQDMARDATMGRIYAPRQMWAEHSVDEAMILAARPTPQLQALLESWVAQARVHLEAGAELSGRVPRWLAIDVQLFRAGGLAILQQIRAARYDVWTRRPTVSKAHKLRLLAAALIGAG
jgi:squalene synthase HpnC